MIRLRVATRQVRPGVILLIDQYQNAAESYVLSVAAPLAIACYAGAFVAPRIGALGALFAGLSALIALVFIALVASTAVRMIGIRPVNLHRFNGGTVLTLLALASSYFALSELWVRWIGRTFLAGLGLNLIAAVVLWLVRDYLTALEREYEGGS
ncbi:MAG: hypothetical protein JJE51_02020 [Thermoanaerobaculia bacterium]|nr:hypothetical protein [Thermoanaerobaculia bacterium]